MEEAGADGAGAGEEGERAAGDKTTDTGKAAYYAQDQADESSTIVHGKSFGGPLTRLKGRSAYERDEGPRCHVAGPPNPQNWG